MSTRGGGRYGEGGIRTPDRGISPYNGLANRRLQPLGHLSNYTALQLSGPTGAAVPSKCAGHDRPSGPRLGLHARKNRFQRVELERRRLCRKAEGSLSRERGHVHPTERRPAVGELDLEWHRHHEVLRHTLLTHPHA